MKTTIYYFTGTGNSQWAAAALGEELGETEIVSIPVVMKNEGAIRAPPGRVGIVAPVYYGGLPAVVVQFLERLDLSGAEYTFAVITCGVSPHRSLLQAKAMLEKNGCTLSLGRGLKVVNNFVPVFSVPDTEGVEKKLGAARARLSAIGSEIRAGGSGIDTGIPGFSHVISIFGYPGFLRSHGRKDTDFRVDETCTKCGTCAKVCPVQNIVMNENGPVWQHWCEFCFACLHYCPAEAIQYGRGTKGKKRYHHPDVNVQAMIRNRG